ncbi:MAG: DUF6691 family protein [Lysobacterales bacterium]
MRLILTYLTGLVFGVGIAISGMINPAKVINFFDFAGTWDPSLALVMGSALVVSFIGYRLVFMGSKPMLGDAFQIPARRRIDPPLIAGSVIFGIGWGISGFCPGGALPALGTGKKEVLMFVAALIAGIVAVKAVRTIVAGGTTPADR